ncbi:hypothetical protein SS50377_26576 [Spironucleus salmonicida]|uniref:Uncharacterized protein n=1 Tax=Spironucleus salmonicida TaxID=348837 RepID=V6LL73_9EUKA|nr:hypothetical protein SS50377_26576 [Spironucleus salmonicida]|eukprot:EST41429.1 Hypothetical protein SS50377_19146 [Spironucleus salmonicida]
MNPKQKLTNLLRVQNSQIKKIQSFESQKIARCQITTGHNISLSPIIQKAINTHNSQPAPYYQNIFNINIPQEQIRLKKYVFQEDYKYLFALTKTLVFKEIRRRFTKLKSEFCQIDIFDDTFAYLFEARQENKKEYGNEWFEQELLRVRKMKNLVWRAKFQ